MKKIINKWIIPIIIGVIVEVLAALITSFINNITIPKAFGLTCKFILKLFSIQIPLWLIICFIIIFVIVLKIKVFFISKIEEKPWYEDYKQDIYKGNLYKWDYYTSRQTFQIRNLHRICNQCEGELNRTWDHNHIHYGTEMYFCPNCDKFFESPSSYDDSIAQTYFENKIRKKLKENQEK